MQIYYYDRKTGEYSGEEAAQLDPLESIKTGASVFMVPAFATIAVPPPQQEGYTRCFVGGNWVQTEDHRGKTIYNTSDAVPVQITELGPIPAGYTTLPPCAYPKWTGTQWVSDIEQARQSKLAQLAAYRYARETAGINVNGVTIKTDRESQAMITGAKLFSDLNPDTLIDWKGASGWIQISREMLTAIGQAVGAHVQACFSREKEHTMAILALDTVEEIEVYNITAGWPL